MKKLFALCMLMFCSNVFAESYPCWMRIGTHTFDSAKITYMAYYPNSEGLGSMSNRVSLYFGKDYFNVLVPDAAGGQDLITKIVAQTDKCYGFRR